MREKLYPARKCRVRVSQRRDSSLYRPSTIQQPLFWYRRFFVAKGDLTPLGQDSNKRARNDFSGLHLTIQRHDILYGSFITLGVGEGGGDNHSPRSVQGVASESVGVERLDSALVGQTYSPWLPDESQARMNARVKRKINILEQSRCECKYQNIVGTGTILTL